MLRKQNKGGEGENKLKDKKPMKQIGVNGVSRVERNLK